MTDISRIAQVLRLPQQDLLDFHHFALSESAAQAWASALPGGNQRVAAQLLRQAISELNRFALPPVLRFQMLEALRAPLLNAAEGMTRTLVGQSPTLAEEFQQRAEVIADLYELSAAGYSLVAVHTIRSRDAITAMNPARLACEALQRAVSLRGLSTRLSLLLYRPPGINAWSTLHHLYALAERQQLARLPLTDPLLEEETSIASDYMVPLLLACCRTNQLRQQDILTVYRAFHHWRQLASLDDPDMGSGLFLIDLNEDQGPRYARPQGEPVSGMQRFINTRALVSKLGELRQRSASAGNRGVELDRQTRLDRTLLDHLVRALSEVSQRNFQRRPGRHRLWIASGLSNVHYFLAGERTLEQVIHGDDYLPDVASRVGDANPFMTETHAGDTWSRPGTDTDHAVPTDGGEGGEFAASVPEGIAEAALPIEAPQLLPAEEPGDNPRKHSVFSVESSNISPGGYCVQWESLPTGVQVGDVVCLHEQAEPRGGWSVAVIRWVSQTRDCTTTVGLELLSPRGTAYAARVKSDSGELSRPIRVILLPEVALVGQSHTLLAPRLVFRENQKIIIMRSNEQFLVRLKRQISATAAFGQFDFDYLRQLDDDAGSTLDSLTPKVFDSVWSNI